MSMKGLTKGARTGFLGLVIAVLLGGAWWLAGPSFLVVPGAEWAVGWRTLRGRFDGTGIKDVTIAVDGSVYACGDFRGAVDFDPSWGFEWRRSQGEGDAFLCKFDSSGQLKWVLAWGGRGPDSCREVAADRSGAVCVAGEFEGAIALPQNIGASRLSSWSQRGMFALSLGPSAELRWAKTWEVPSPAALLLDDLVFDSRGAVLAVGTYWSAVDLDPGAGVWAPTQPEGCFLLKLDPHGEFQWARTCTAAADNFVGRVTTDSLGNIYVAGHADETIVFDASPAPLYRSFTYEIGHDSGTYVAKFGPRGDVQWIRAWSNLNAYHGYGPGLGVDAAGNVYLSGHFTVTSHLVEDPSLTLTAERIEDAFVSKFDSEGRFLWVRTWGGRHHDLSTGLALDSRGDVYVSGLFEELVDFDPGPGEEVREAPIPPGARHAPGHYVSQFDQNGEFKRVLTDYGWGFAVSDFQASVDSLSSVIVYGRTRLNVFVAKYPPYANP